MSTSEKKELTMEQKEALNDINEMFCNPNNARDYLRHLLSVLDTTFIGLEDGTNSDTTLGLMHIVSLCQKLNALAA